MAGKRTKQLQDENKKLKDELEIYYRQKIDRVPKLAVTLNVDTFDDECEIKCHPEYIQVYRAGQRRFQNDMFPLEI